MAIPKKIYSDIDLNFLPQPGNQDLSLRYNERAITASVRNLVFTAPGERFFNPNLGSNVRKLLFEPCTPLTATSIQEEITRTINNYEPRVELIGIEVVATPDQNAFTATIVFYILNKTEPSSITVLLKRAR